MAGILSPKLTWELANPRWAAQINPLFSQVAGLLGLPILQGHQITAVALALLTPKAIPHNLGAVPRGWFVMDNIANAVIWRTAWTEQTITLEASAATTVNIWVF